MLAFFIILAIFALALVWAAIKNNTQKEGYADQVAHGYAGNIAGPISDPDAYYKFIHRNREGYRSEWDPLKYRFEREYDDKDVVVRNFGLPFEAGHKTTDADYTNGPYAAQFSEECPFGCPRECPFGCSDGSCPYKCASKDFNNRSI
jgi:hypothetical protein